MIQNSYFQLRFKPFLESARLDLGTIFVLLLAGILSLPVIRIQCTVYLISKMLIGFEYFFRSRHSHCILGYFYLYGPGARQNIHNIPNMVTLPNRYGPRTGESKVLKYWNSIFSCQKKSCLKYTARSRSQYKDTNSCAKIVWGKAFIISFRTHHYLVKPFLV